MIYYGLLGVLFRREEKSLIEIKWVEKFEAGKLGIDNLCDVDENTRAIYKRYLVADIVAHEYIFSGEHHLYGAGVPVFMENGKPVAKMVTFEDSWAVFMYEIWRGSLNGDVQAWQFRKKSDLERVVECRVPV